MKKIGLLFLTALVALTLPACNDDEGDYPYIYGIITTVHTLGDEGAYYFERDNGQTLFPSEKPSLYTAEEGTRAIIYFDLLDQSVPDYDYNIRLYRVEEIYTGASRVVTTQEELDGLGNDGAGFPTAYWEYFNLTQKWLTLYLLYPVTDNTKHDFEVIVNKVTTPEQSEEGYLNLELRHSAGGDVAGYTQGHYVSFDLASITAELEGKKGVILRIDTRENGTKYLKLDLPEANR